LDRGRLNETVSRNWSEVNFESVFPKVFEWLKHRLVLDGSGNDVLPPDAFSIPGSAKQGYIVAFGCATGEIDFIWLGIEKLRNLHSSFIDGRLRTLAKNMRAAPGV
jgi:hypothetical protein